MHRGYIKLWRKTIDSGLIRNHKVWIFWTWCLLKANHKPSHKQVVGYQEVILEPGQFVFGLKKASAETGLSIQEIRTCIKFLEKYENLTYNPTNKFSIVSIMNWESYQQTEDCNNSQTNKQPTSSQQAGNKQVTTNKHINTEEHKNIGTVNTVPVNGTDVPPTQTPQNCPHKEIRNLYNQVLGDTLPQCKLTTTTFDKMLKTRWRESKDRQSLDWWTKYFNYIRESDFLMGRTDNDFMASFEWIIRPTNMAKIINGNYHKKGKKQQSIEEYAKEHGYV